MLKTKANQLQVQQAVDSRLQPVGVHVSHFDMSWSSFVYNCEKSVRDFRDDVRGNLKMIVLELIQDTF